MAWTVSDILSIITIAMLLIVIVGDRTLGWLKTRGVDLSRLGDLYELSYNTHQDTQELIKRFDDSSLEVAIRALAENVAAQTLLLQEMVQQNKLNHQEHRLILDQIGRKS
jgi:hypothetical protein